MKLSVLKVKGNSMHPALESGAFVLVWQSKFLYKYKHIVRNLPVIGQHLGFAKGLNKGDIVVVNHPKYGRIIKRIAKIEYDIRQLSELKKPQVACYQLVRLRLRGDNKNGTVSEHDMGWVSVEQLMGKVVYVVGK